MKSIILFINICFLLFCFIQSAFTQNVNIGNSSYATLKEAFDQINNGTHTGVISVIIVDNTVETSTAVLNESGFGAASYSSVLITPFETPVTVSGSFTGALVKLAAADNVTIDGRISGAGRNLTFKNSVLTTTHSAVIWVSDRVTASATGAKNNIIRNCNISGGVDQSLFVTSVYGIIFSGETMAVPLSSYQGKDNDNNEITENYIYKCMHGIIFGGSSLNLNDSNRITKNIVGSEAFNSDRITRSGISAEYQNYCLIEGNEVRFLGALSTDAVSPGGENIGIQAGGFSYSIAPERSLGTNYTVNGNLIHDIINEKDYTAVGIGVSTSAAGISTGNLISNNVIYNVRSLVYSPFGIAHAGGYGDKIVFNSINLYGGLGTSSKSGVGIGVLYAEDTALVIKNNSIYINYTYTSASTILRSHCIVLPSTSYSWGTGGCNYNDYYFPAVNTQMKVGGTGTSALYTVYPDLPSWRFLFTPTQDLLSFSGNPLYTSITNLFPLPGSPLLGAGTPVSGVTKDFLGETRSALSPSIGAYEFDSVTLPVELISFNSNLIDNDVILNWSSLSELNNAGFDIERKDQKEKTNVSWKKIGSLSGHGTTSIVQNYFFKDNNLLTGSYSYRLKQIDFNGNFEYFNLSNEVVIGIPEKFELSQNYPNPFNPSTKIDFSLPADGLVTMKIFDMSGKEVMTLLNEVKTAGYHSVNFNASNLSSGIYFYRLSAADYTDTKKMMLVK
ncbi:MAG: T9SS type A sorting domain-containing protein [Bacteroidetes bacterium]|nr:T9SS type A sorting domain-containing protein [Bacteroidota bacterium]